MNLVEKYNGRLAISESVFKKAHAGDAMDNNRKLAIAKVLENTNAFLTEAFDSGSATQRADMQDFKKFCLNLTTVALPNLIANELVMVQPMSSMTGYVAYIQYEAGVDKGGVKRGDVFNDPFRLGEVNANYTADAVVEPIAAAASTFVAAWLPVVKGVFTDASGAAKDAKVIKADGTEVFADFGEDGKTLTVALVAGDKVAYKYDNIIIPQATIPSIKAEMKNIPLLAHARRIAVYYSQIAAFQAKQDYGFDLADQLAEKAVGQLSYEIDTEVTDLLIANAKENEGLVFSKTLPVGVSKMEHYAGFAEILEIGRQIVYDATKRFAPNYMLIASNVLPVLSLVPGFKAAPATNINGPYLAGELNGLKVFVTPNIAAGKFILGVNGDDLMTSAAVYAPYMAIVPTQLLQFADGGTTQGFSTMYDLKMLNEDLLVAGKITA